MKENPCEGSILRATPSGQAFARIFVDNFINHPTLGKPSCPDPASSAFPLRQAQGSASAKVPQKGTSRTTNPPCASCTNDLRPPPTEMIKAGSISGWTRKNLYFIDAAGFWRTTDDPLFRLDGIFPFSNSNHRSGNRFVLKVRIQCSAYSLVKFLQPLQGCFCV